VPSASEPYCPYDISTDPAPFDLVADRLVTRFGKTLVLRRPAPSSDTATLFLHGVGARWTTWTPTSCERGYNCSPNCLWSWR